MTENTDKVNLLLNKLEDLVKKQENFSREVSEIREEIVRLKDKENKSEPESPEKIKISPVLQPAVEIKVEKKSSASQHSLQQELK